MGVAQAVDQPSLTLEAQAELIFVMRTGFEHFERKGALFEYITDSINRAKISMVELGLDAKYIIDELADLGHPRHLGDSLNA
jgi:hypothetical protein